MLELRVIVPAIPLRGARPAPATDRQHGLPSRKALVLPLAGAVVMSDLDGLTSGATVIRAALRLKQRPIARS